MHHVEDLRLLALHVNTDLLAEFLKFLLNLVKRLLGCSKINDHHHVEITLNDSLRDIIYINSIIGQLGTDLSDDTNGILTYDSDDCSVGFLIFHFFSSFSFQRLCYGFNDYILCI